MGVKSIKPRFVLQGMLVLFGLILTKVTMAEDLWRNGTIQHAGGAKTIVRLRADAPTDKNEFKFLISIKWSYEKDKFGLPAEGVLKQMERFEDYIYRPLESSRAGLLAVVFTGKGSREWQWYTQDPDSFMKTFGSALEGKPLFPIELTVNQDEGWEAFETIHKEFVKTPITKRGNTGEPAT